MLWLLHREKAFVRTTKAFLRLCALIGSVALLWSGCSDGATGYRTSTMIEEQEPEPGEPLPDVPTPETPAPETPVPDMPEPVAEPQPEPGLEQTLVLVPRQQRSLAGDRVQFRALLIDAEGGSQDITAVAQWRIVPDGGAEQESPGRFRVSQAGNYDIFAVWEDREAQGALEVQSAQENLVGITIEPVRVDIPVLFETRLVALGIFEDGQSQNLTAMVSWASREPGIATVENGGEISGTVRGIAEGETTITASFAGFEAEVTVGVTPALLESIEVVPREITVPAGDSATLQALGRFSDGGLLEISESVDWEVEDPGVARVENVPGATGRVEGLEMGETIVRAQMDGIVGEATVVVTDASVVELTFTPSLLRVAAGGSTGLRASAVLRNGVALDVTREAVWNVVDPLLGEIVQRGDGARLEGFLPGNSEVVVRYGSMEARAPLTVTEAVLESLSLTPEALQVPVGTLQRFVLIGTYSDTSRSNLSFDATWTIDDPEIAVVGNDALGGVITARQAGTTTATARVGDHEISAGVVVTDAEIVAIQIQPSRVSVAVGDEVSLQSFAVYSDNSLRNITQEATWVSDDESVAVVSNAQGQRGQITGVSPGELLVHVRFAGFDDSASVTVSDAVVEDLYIIPRMVQVVAGRSQNLNLFAVYSNGATQVVAQEATWSSGNTEVLQVSNANNIRGRITGLVPGTASVIASFGGREASITVRVLDATLEQIIIAPPNEISTSPGLSVQLIAVGIFSDRSVRDNITGQVVWSSDEESVAQVGNFPASPGLVQGVRPGTTVIRAQSGDVVAQKSIRVVEREIVSLEVSPPEAILPVDALQQFFVIAQFDDDSSIDVTNDVTWRSSDSAVVAVLPVRSGLVNTLQPGEVTLEARLGDLAGEAMLTVREAEATTVIVSPVNPQLNRNQMGPPLLSLFATALYEDGTTSDFTQLCQWTSSNPSALLVLDELGAKGTSIGLMAGVSIVTAHCGSLPPASTIVTVR